MPARSSNCSVSAKFFPMLVEMPYFWGVINPKTYLNHDLGSKFFFLSSLAYKLVNLLVCEKISCKMSKNWSFIKIIGRGLNFTYEFEVCSIWIQYILYILNIRHSACWRIRTLRYTAVWIFVVLCTSEQYDALQWSEIVWSIFVYFTTV